MGRTRSTQPDLNAILFGYFSAEADDVGPNLPGQTVFTCLSHDIIAHEMTHAIVDRLRPLFLEPSNVDVLAFHEGFADIVALFQHFSYPDIVRDQIQRSRARTSATPNALVAAGAAIRLRDGQRQALRSALDEPDAEAAHRPSLEPHDRGSILVAAVFDGFFKTYQRRINDLIRIATGGTGTLPQGDLHPDLVNRIADEASRTAQRVLDMCIRAFDYMPPVDVTFGDFLRAMITADFELVPDDAIDCRGAMIEAFRLRGIYPDGVGSLAEESLLWENVEEQAAALWTTGVASAVGKALLHAVRSYRSSRTRWRRRNPSNGRGSRRGDPVRGRGSRGDRSKSTSTPNWPRRCTQYARDNAERLAPFDPSAKIQVRGFHPVFRVTPNGRLLVELVAQFAQADHGSSGDLSEGSRSGRMHAGGVVGRPVPVPHHQADAQGRRASGRQKAGQARVASNRTI